VNYADRGLQYDQEGANRNINVGYAPPTSAALSTRCSPGRSERAAWRPRRRRTGRARRRRGRGYLWDSALRAGLSIRNYGFFGDLTRYEAATGPIRSRCSTIRTRAGGR